jgi:hypothetical protein
MNYIINRLCEESTWKAMYLSIAMIVVLLIEECHVTPRTIAIIVAVVVFILMQAIAWTRDCSKTPNRWDDMVHAAARAALIHMGKNPDA